MGKNLVFTFLFAIVFVFCFGQTLDSVEINVLVKKDSNLKPLKNVDIDVVEEKTKKIIRQHRTDSSGFFSFKLNFKKYHNTNILIRVDHCTSMIMESEIFIDSSSDHWQEFIISKGTEPMPYPNILFEKNEFEKIGSYFKVSGIESFIKGNPATMITLVARYNFDENPEVAEKRLAFVKNKLSKSDINLDRVDFEVMSPDFIYYYLDSYCDTVFFSPEKFVSADSTEKQIYEIHYQCVNVRINSWDYKPKKYTCSIFLKVRDQNSGEPIENAKVETYLNNKKYQFFRTKSGGIVQFKLDFNSLADSLQLKIKHENYISRHHNSFQLNPNYNFSEEFFLIKETTSDGRVLSFHFKENETQPIKDSLEQVYNMYIEYLEQNPSLIMSINANYNFYENNSVHRERVENIKQGFIKRGVDPKRLVTSVNDELFYLKYVTKDNPAIIEMDEQFMEKATKEELKYLKNQYQSVFITIDSFDYEQDE